MGDLLAVEQIGDPTGRQERGLDLLHRIQSRRCRGPRAPGDEGVAAVALQGRVGLDDDEQVGAVRLVAGLFAELAKRGVLGRFARVDHAAGDLERERVAPEAVLPYEDDLVARRQRNHVAPVVAAEGERVPAGLPARILELDAVDLEDAVGAGELAFDSSPLAQPGKRYDQGRVRDHAGTDTAPERSASEGNAKLR